jgi:hypothetical protein
MGRLGGAGTLRIVVVLFALVATSGCAGGPEGAGTGRNPDATPKAESLVGTWERETRCQEMVAALERAGLENWVLEFVAGNGFIPADAPPGEIPAITDPDQIADPAHPCRGAVPRIHSHFFTRDGEFGSLDWNGDPVDDGTYEVVDDHTFVISKEFPEGATFSYTIQGDTITFDPVIPDCAPECFEAAWSVVVAYPGETWERVG